LSLDLELQDFDQQNSCLNDTAKRPEMLRYGGFIDKGENEKKSKKSSYAPY